MTFNVTQYIARIYDGPDTPPPEQEFVLRREGGFPLLVGQYVEIEIGIDGEHRTTHIHGHVVESNDERVVLKGHRADNPRKVWAVTPELTRQPERVDP